MESFRYEYKVTLKEEEALRKEVEKMFKALIRLKMESNVRDMVDQCLNQRSVSGYIFNLYWNQSINHDAIVSLLGRIRKSKKR